MVGNINPNSRDVQRNSGDRDSEGRDRGERLWGRHNIDPIVIRHLIQGALAPLPTDPIPEWVLIRNIFIARDQGGNLSISCDVVLGTEDRRGV